MAYGRLKPSAAFLEDTCTWQAYTGSTQAANMDKTPAYAATATTLKCIIDSPSRKWGASWPDNMDISQAIIVITDTANTLAARDKITYRGKVYFIHNVQQWSDMCIAALCERVEGVD